MWFFLALLAAFFNAFANVARRTHGSLARPIELTWWCMLISLPLCLGLVAVSHQPPWTSQAFVTPALIASIISIVGDVLLFRAYKYAEASVISPLTNLLPLALVVTSAIVLHQYPRPLGFVGIALIVIGVYYSSVNGKLSVLHPLKRALHNKGSRAMLMWVVLMAITTTLVQQALRSASASFMMLFMLSVEFVILSAVLLVLPQKSRLARGERVMRRWGWHMAAIAVFSTLSVFFQFHAMNYINASYVLAIKRLDVLLTVILAGVFLKERHILRRFKGSAIAVVGVIIIYVVT